MESYKRSIRRLQAMGVKVVLASGISEAESRRIALETGILKKEHERICGAVISGSDLRKICTGRSSSLGYDITPEYLSVVYKASAEERCLVIDFLSKLHPGRQGTHSPIGFGSEDFKTAHHIATVGAIGSGENDIKMLNKAKIAFCTAEKCHPDARKAADMVLLRDNIEDVVMAVVKSRGYKDHLQKFIMLQIPASVTAVAFVLSQVFLYESILVTVSYVFLINLFYFPLAIACLVREDSSSRFYEMIERWRAQTYPGTRDVTSYMRAEHLKFSILAVTLF